MHLPLSLSLPRRLPFLIALSLLALLGLGFLEGCQTPGGAAPPTALQTFDALYANAVTADDLVIQAGTAALASGLISPQQAAQVLKVSDSVKTALDAAYAAAQLGNQALATGNLAQALGPVAILSACLTAKPLTVASFAACTQKLTPAPAVLS